ncbi:hypothetical protein NL676_036002 [Syzygium grande]|nr:hypothetical protein NL676_036002 [Syzygium grande]
MYEDRRGWVPNGVGPDPIRPDKGGAGPPAPIIGASGSAVIAATSPPSRSSPRPFPPPFASSSSAVAAFCNSRVTSN